MDQFLLPMVAYCILLKLSIFVNLKFQKIKTEASVCDKFVFQKVYFFFFKKFVYLFKHAFQLLPSIWSVLLECLHHFYVVIFYRVFFEMFVFVFVCGFALFFLLLLFFSVLFLFLAKILAPTVKIQTLQQPL